MHPISSISIESLPNELLLPILEACAVPSLFSVCKRWHHLLATEVMPPLYKQIGKVHAPCRDVKEQALIVDKIYKLEEKLSEAAKVNAIFRQIFTLAKSLAPAELEFKWKTQEKRYFTLANYASYLIDINRLLMWKALPGGAEYLSQEKIKYLPLEKQGELLRDWIEENCKNITMLDLSKKGLTYLPPEIGQLSDLQTLSLNQNQLTSLPTEIGQLSQLQKLYLSQNQLTSLPTEIGQLSKLQYLLLDQNQLTALPTEIGQLSQLEWLESSQNQLTALPAEIGQLSQLQLLYLNQNQLASLPTETGQLSQLKGLFLNQNQLASLPAEIGQLSNLVQLYLNQNQLTALPIEIGQLSKLQWLDLSQNQLTALPAEIGQLPQLTQLELAKNPLKDIVEKNKAAFSIVEWLKYFLNWGGLK
ncbi:leucine-rich repeat domain-containing protein [Neochlamydia sp. EPS4]|uniref:leucine-rich repeat domain-containing protein n=1 Tax=Neochlamydia sp. EPS4 TaxID=1478175 RepID=UPI000694B7A2|nr:leucine-rich repeat domain-containing protein [Neochlamydia sp. EPS4]